MDPDGNLSEQREIVGRLLAAFDGADPDTGEWQPDADDVYRLTELSEGLDGWLSRGGALPRAWQHEDPDSAKSWAPSDRT
jgi:hypothetical protein